MTAITSFYINFVLFYLAIWLPKLNLDSSYRLSHRNIISCLDVEHRRRLSPGLGEPKNHITSLSINSSSQISKWLFFRPKFLFLKSKFLMTPFCHIIVGT